MITFSPGASFIGKLDKIFLTVTVVVNYLLIAGSEFSFFIIVETSERYLPG